MVIGYLRNKDTLPGISLDKVFKEDEKFVPDSKVLKKCIQILRPGDILYIETLDMLGNSFMALKTTVDNLVDRGVVVNFIKEAIEFSQDHGSPEGQTALNVLNHAAAFEKRAAKTKLNGLRNPGRPDIRFSSQAMDKVITDISNGKTRASIAKELDVSRPTLNKLINNRKQELKLLSGEKAV